LLLERAQLTNVRVVVRDAVEIMPLLPDAGFSGVDLFFPDPWPKKRHHKRRIVQPPFVAELARVLRAGGLLHVATDWADFARHTREVLAASSAFDTVDATELADEPLAIRPPTKFERRGVRLGHEVADLYYRARE
jgi:tRNA (guanine-N7-)-methyltransferase